MTATELALRNVKCPGRVVGTETTPISAAQSSRRRAAAFVTAGALSVGTLVGPSYGQVGGTAGAVSANRPQTPAVVTAETLSCKQLKDSLQSAGTLNIVSGQKGWGETFYGPDVPQCEFWSRPMFQYVNTNDGPCGVGYLCAPRVTGGR